MQQNLQKAPASDSRFYTSHVPVSLGKNGQKKLSKCVKTPPELHFIPLLYVTVTKKTMNSVLFFSFIKSHIY